MKKAKVIQCFFRFVESRQDETTSRFDNTNCGHELKVCIYIHVIGVVVCDVNAIDLKA